MLLITGITGHSGRYFLQELINHKYGKPIRCIVRTTSESDLLDKSGLNIEKVYGDLNDSEFIRASVKGVDEIMHIYNIHHSPIIVEAAIDNKVKRAILVHTTGIYSKFNNASQRYRNIERKVAEMTSDPNCVTKITILRPTMIYGDLCDSNISKFIRIIDKLSIVPVIDGGKCLIQPVNARDLGRAYYDVLESPKSTANKAYDLSGEEPIQMIEVFKIISKHLNKKIMFVSVSLGFGELLAKLAKLLTLGRVDYVEKVQRMAEDRSYSNEKAKKDFGYSTMSLDQGIEVEVKQYFESK